MKDEVTSEFPLNYHYKKSKMDKFLKCEKIGNLLAIADNENNIYFYEKDNWDEVSGQLNFSYTLPSFWNIFNYSEK